MPNRYPVIPSDSDPADGWGTVPVAPIPVGSSTPSIPSDPAAQQAQTEAVQTQNEEQRSQLAAVSLPPVPAQAPIAGNLRVSPPWLMWFTKLYQQRLGGAISGSTDEAILLSEFETGTVLQQVPSEDYLLEPSLSLSQVRAMVGAAVQDAVLLAEPAPVKDHLTTWNDWNLSISGAKVPAANSPTWNALVGNLYAYQFAVNDYLYMESQEFLHDWAEGTDIHIHLHWVTGGLNDATVRGVKWEAEYSVCNTLEAAFGGSTFTSATVVSSESSIAANEPNRTHRISSIGVIPGANYRIGSQIVMRLRRIAATGTAPAANPFAISFGLHYQSDTPGSRSVATK